MNVLNLCGKHPPLPKGAPPRPPAHTIAECASDLGTTVTKLRSALRNAGAPKPTLNGRAWHHCSGANRYNPREVRAWWEKLHAAR